jgi:hypothetical protein
MYFFNQVENCKTLRRKHEKRAECIQREEEENRPCKFIFDKFSRSLPSIDFGEKRGGCCREFEMHER